MHPHPEPIVGLVHHQGVGAGLAEDVAEDPRRPQRLVQRDPPQGAAVCGPLHPRRRPLDPIGEQGAGRQIQEPDLEDLTTGGVDGVRQDPMIRADLHPADPEVVVAPGQLVDVEQDLLGTSVAGRPAVGDVGAS